MDMCYNIIVPLIPLTIGAISGTLMIFILSSFISKKLYFTTPFRMLLAIGRETFIVVAFSQIVVMVMNQYLTVNSIVKYLLLVLFLIVVKYLKDGVNRLCKTKIL